MSASRRYLKPPDNVFLLHRRRRHKCPPAAAILFPALCCRGKTKPDTAPSSRNHNTSDIIPSPQQICYLFLNHLNNQIPYQRAADDIFSHFNSVNNLHSESHFVPGRNQIIAVAFFTLAESVIMPDNIF